MYCACIVHLVSMYCQCIVHVLSMYCPCIPLIDIVVL